MLHFSDLADSTRFIAMLLLLLRASQYGRTLQSTYHQAMSWLPYLETIDERESELRSSRTEAGSVELTEFAVLELRDVSYVYDQGQGQAALDRVSMRIERGDVIGVIGPSGSGKSTLADILLGLRLPTSGAYLIDGRPFGDLDPGSWHHLTGLVTQEPQLIEGDLSDNIRFMRDFVTDADITDAVTASGQPGPRLFDGLRPDRSQAAGFRVASNVFVSPGIGW
jgi:ABC-type multidrug transport system fused ATPase/permease subunit